MISIKTKEEISAMREGGMILARVLKEVAEKAAEGVSLIELDRLAFKKTKESGAEPAFLGYKPGGASRPYPASICASLNDVVVHGVPNSYKLQNGDLLKIDFGVRYKGFCTDAAVSVPIGEVGKVARKLMEATKESLDAAIRNIGPGKRLGDLGYAVERAVLRRGFAVVSGLTGHGIGKKLHEDPVVYNFGKPGKGLELKPGMTLAIEPMVSVGSGDIIQKRDESYATSDGSLSAHFEHTVVVTERGVEVLTVL